MVNFSINIFLADITVVPCSFEFRVVSTDTINKISANVLASYLYNFLYQKVTTCTFGGNFGPYVLSIYITVYIIQEKKTALVFKL